MRVTVQRRQGTWKPGSLPTPGAQVLLSERGVRGRAEHWRHCHTEQRSGDYRRRHRRHRHRDRACRRPLPECRGEPSSFTPCAEREGVTGRAEHWRHCHTEQRSGDYRHRHRHRDHVCRRPSPECREEPSSFTSLRSWSVGGLPGGSPGMTRKPEQGGLWAGRRTAAPRHPGRARRPCPAGHRRCRCPGPSTGGTACPQGTPGRLRTERRARPADRPGTATGLPVSCPLSSRVLAR